MSIPAPRVWASTATDAVHASCSAWKFVAVRRLENPISAAVSTRLDMYASVGFRCAGAPMNSPSEASWQNQRTSREWGPEVVTVISQSDVISPLKYARPRRGPPLRPLVGPLIAVIQWKGYT